MLAYLIQKHVSSFPFCAWRVANPISDRKYDGWIHCGHTQHSCTKMNEPRKFACGQVGITRPALLSTAKLLVNSMYSVPSGRLANFRLAGGMRKQVTSPKILRDALKSFMHPTALIVLIVSQDANR